MALIGNNNTSQKKPTTPAAMSAMQKAYVTMTPEDETAMINTKIRRANATTQEEKNRAHTEAEAIREKYGFSGGAAGDDYIKTKSTMEKALDKSLGEGGYTSSLSPQISSLLNSINTSSFSYDPAKDEQFQQYKNQMIDSGQKAYGNIVAGASTPGVSTNSVAEQIAQGANTEFLNKIGDAESSFMDKAYQRYKDNQSNDYNQLSALLGIDTTGYNRFADNRDYTYDAGQDTIVNNLNQKQFNEGVRQFNVGQGNWQKEYALDEKQVNANIANMNADNARQAAAARSSSGSSSGGKSSSSTKSGKGFTLSQYATKINKMMNDVRETTELAIQPNGTYGPVKKTIPNYSKADIEGYIRSLPLNPNEKATLANYVGL